MASLPSHHAISCGSLMYCTSFQPINVVNLCGKLFSLIDYAFLETLLAPYPPADCSISFSLSSSSLVRLASMSRSKRSWSPVCDLLPPHAFYSVCAPLSFAISRSTLLRNSRSSPRLSSEIHRSGSRTSSTRRCRRHHRAARENLEKQLRD